MKAVRVTTVQALMGAAISAADEHLKIFPYDKYHQGARDNSVNLLKALNELLKKETIEVPDDVPAVREYLDKTKI